MFTNKKKFFYFFTLFLFLTSFFIPNVLGLSLNSPNEIVFDQDYEEYKNITITIGNENSFALEDLKWNVNLPTDFDVIIYNQFDNMDPNSQKSALLSIKMSKWVESGKNNIGNIEIFNDNDSVEFNVYTDKDTMLDIYEMSVSRNSDDFDEIDSGDVLEVKPEDLVSFEIEIENLFNDEEQEMKDVTVSLYIDDLYGNTEKLESDVKDIDGDDRETFSLSFEIPKTANEDEYEINVVVSGFSDNYGYHKIESNFYVDVIRENYEFELEPILSPDRLVCGETDFRLYVKVLNTGSRKANDLRIDISSDDSLRLNYTEEFSLDESFYGNENKYEKRLTGVLLNNEEGISSVRVNLYRSEQLILSKVVTLESVGCQVDSDTEESSFEIIYTDNINKNETTSSNNQQEDSKYQIVTNKNSLSLFDIIFFANIGVIILVSLFVLYVLAIKKPVPKGVEKNAKKKVTRKKSKK